MEIAISLGVSNGSGGSIGVSEWINEMNERLNDWISKHNTNTNNKCWKNKSSLNIVWKKMMIIILMIGLRNEYKYSN